MLINRNTEDLKQLCPLHSIWKIIKMTVYRKPNKNLSLRSFDFKMYWCLLLPIFIWSVYMSLHLMNKSNSKWLNMHTISHHMYTCINLTFAPVQMLFPCPPPIHKGNQMIVFLLKSWSQFTIWVKLWKFKPTNILEQ